MAPTGAHGRPPRTELNDEPLQQPPGAAARLHGGGRRRAGAAPAGAPGAGGHGGAHGHRARRDARGRLRRCRDGLPAHAPARRGALRRRLGGRVLRAGAAHPERTAGELGERVRRRCRAPGGGRAGARAARPCAQRARPVPGGLQQLPRRRVLLRRAGPAPRGAGPQEPRVLPGGDAARPRAGVRGGGHALRQQAAARVLLPRAAGGPQAGQDADHHQRLRRHAGGNLAGLWPRGAGARLPPAAGHGAGADGHAALVPRPGLRAGVRGHRPRGAGLPAGAPGHRPAPRGAHGHQLRRLLRHAHGGARAAYPSADRQFAHRRSARLHGVVRRLRPGAVARRRGHPPGRPGPHPGHGDPAAAARDDAQPDGAHGA